ncbi:probable RNA-directed DNA polymerase from transposon BS [Caerostris darwini]|uniref:Probable RNA-directed DNA polymerase from transposon BS n=1 Tax=Caerostris darwini TaxID=1538125 RepID=A0AAV4MCQ5_9ARAC|nr:probable RNA-directed DNA polymerase from transposon BS [Caerostris darwini]
MTEESDFDNTILPIMEDISDSSSVKDLDLDCESMMHALTFYNHIMEHTATKDIKKKVKQAIRVNALAIVKIVASQNNYIAQLEGRVQAMENIDQENISNQQALITEIVAKELDKKFPAVSGVTNDKEGIILESTRPTFAEKVKTTAPFKKDISKPSVVPQKKFVTTIKPKVVNSTNSSLKMKTTIRNKIDIRKLNVGVKSVRLIRDGGIIIETVNEEDLDKLIAEFKKQDELAGDFNIAKPVARWPQIICFDVDTETTKEDILVNLRQQFPKEDNIEKDFVINHSFTNKRGKDWIVEINPKMFKTVLKEKRINLGWERISFKEYVRPTHCFKCGKFGHVAKYCNSKEEICTNCGAHINLGNSRAANIQLNQSITSLNYDFLSINEPYTFDNKITCIPKEYTIIAHGVQPKAALIIKNKYQCQMIFQNRFLVVTQINIQNIDCLVISAYCPPRGELSNCLNNIQFWIEKYPHFKVLLFGDFNAKSKVWGKRNDDERGKQLISFANLLEMNIENSPDLPPTFDCCRGQSWIDLLLTKNIAQGISLAVLDEISNSDHRLLHCIWTFSSITLQHSISLNLRNWLDVKCNVSNIIEQYTLLEPIDLDATISHIQKEIVRTLSRPTGISTHSNKRRNAIWWTKELQIKRSKTRALRRLYQKESNSTLHTIKKVAFKKSLAEYKKQIINTKRNKFKHFINSITTSNCFGKNFNIITNKKPRTIATTNIVKEDGTLTNSITETHSTILDFHFPLTGAPCNNWHFDRDPNFLEISHGELESIIENIKPRKAPGPDGIPGEIVKEIYYAGPEWFRGLLNQLLEKGEFPAIWKTAKVALIPKTHKDQTHPSGYRPICLLPCWGKIFDKIIAERLSFFLEDRNLLNNLQFGFRKKRSTINALQNIISFISNAHARNHVTCIISLDVANAFNSANWSILKQKLQNLNIPTYLKAILHSFLQDRRVTLGEVNQPYDKGIPQGSCLGPILWNIFVNGILDIDVGQYSCIQAFADEVVILFSAPATYHFTNMCIAPLKKVSNWLIQNDLQLNHDKSIFSIFAKKNYSHIPNIKIGSHKIKYLKQFKYLGLVMDKQLSWHAHLDYVTSKITKLMQKINRTTRVYWGLSPPVKKEIYNRVLEKIMFYGHEIWFNGKAKQVTKLNKLQRIGLLNVTKCNSTVSTDALQILAGVPLIEVTLRSLTKLYQFRHLQFDIFLNNQLYSYNNLEKRPNIEPPWYKQKFKWRHLFDREGGHCIFTDGSKMNNRVGCAMVVVENGVETSHRIVRINDEASVFMAELKAIEMAIHHIITHNIIHSKIITDSRSVLQALNNPANCSPSIFHLKQLLSLTTANIELVWTRAHIGIHGNELADHFAKQATSKDIIDQHMYIPIRYIKKLLYHEILTAWQNHWVNSAKGRAVFEIYGKVNPKRILGNFFLNQIITGHGAIASYQCKFFNRSSSCSCGLPIEDRKVKLVHLLENHQVRVGVELIMKNKLETILDGLNDLLPLP